MKIRSDYRNGSLKITLNRGGNTETYTCWGEKLSCDMTGTKRHSPSNSIFVDHHPTTQNKEKGQFYFGETRFEVEFDERFIDFRYNKQISDHNIEILRGRLRKVKEAIEEIKKQASIQEFEL